MWNEDIIKSCTNIVALAGAEQIQKAINTKADIIISGRSTDTAIIASLPIYHGLNVASAWHGAKIAECGALATNNPNSTCAYAERHSQHLAREKQATRGCTERQYCLTSRPRCRQQPAQTQPDAAAAPMATSY